VAGLRRLGDSGRIEAEADLVVLGNGRQLKDAQLIFEECGSTVHRFRMEGDLSTVAARLSGRLAVYKYPGTTSGELWSPPTLRVVQDADGRVGAVRPEAPWAQSRRE
jgi:hypothetical protein